MATASTNAIEQQRMVQLQQLQQRARRKKMASAIKTGAGAVKKGAAGVEAGAAATQGAAKVTQGAAKAGKAVSKGAGAAAKGVGAASKGISSAGKALTSTKVGAIIGAPLMALGAIGQGAGKVGEGAAKAGEAASKAVEKGAKAVDKGAGKVKKGAKKTKDAAEKVQDKVEEEEDAAEDAENLAAGRRNFGQLRGGGALGAAGADMDTKRKASLFANRLQVNLSSRRGLDPISSAGRRDLLDPSSGFRSPEARAQQQQLDTALPESQRPVGTRDVDPTSVNQLRAQLSNIKLKISQTKKRSAKAELEQIKDKQIERIRTQVKRKAKAAGKRGIIYVVDLIAASMDLGTMGISLIVDFFIYMFTFGWLNTELFYGKKFRKGKDPFISPLSWDPIPFPVDPNAVILEGFVIAADIIIVIVGLVFFFVGFCFLYDYSMLTSNPIAFALSVAENKYASCAATLFIP